MVDFRFVGGALGYISYDAIRYIEKLPNQKPDTLGFPDVEMGIFEDGVVFDHTQNQAYYYFRGRKPAKRNRSPAQAAQQQKRNPLATPNPR